MALARERSSELLCWSVFAEKAVGVLAYASPLKGMNRSNKNAAEIERLSWTTITPHGTRNTFLHSSNGESIC
jgi:hypothetical protein